MANLAGLALFGLRFVAKDEITDVLKRVAKNYGFLNKITGNAVTQLANTTEEGGLKMRVALGTAGLVGMQALNVLNQTSTALVGSFNNMIKEASSFESEMVKFGIIAGGTGVDVENLKKEILAFTAPLPTTANEVARAATAFAKMGFAMQLSSRQMIELSFEAIKFGRVIGTSDEQAALFIGKLATWLQVSRPTPDVMNRIASTVSKLGFMIKGTAIDVIRATERFGAFVRAMGATEAQTLALAALVQDSGILIRRGSTAINRTFQLMASNTRAFGSALQSMGQVASDTEFDKLFNTDPVEAFRLLLVGLSTQTGQYATNLLKSLGLHGNYISDLITMSRNTERFSQTITEATKEMTRNRAELSLNDKAYEETRKTFESAMKTYRGAIENLKILAGTPFLKIFSGALLAVADLLGKLIEVSPLLVQIGGILFGALTLGLVLIKVYANLTLTVAALGEAGAKSAAAFAAGFFKVVIVLLAIVALATLAYYVYKKVTGQATTLRGSLKDVASGIGGVSSEITGAVTGGMGTIPGTTPEMAGTHGVALPEMQAGGIVVRPTPVIVGEKESEAIIPLRELAGMMERMMGARSGGTTQSVAVSTPVYLDGMQIARSTREAEFIDNIRQGRA